MSEEAVRDLRLRVFYEDQASGPAGQFHAQERERIKATASEQERADAAYIKATQTKLRAGKQIEDAAQKRASGENRETERSEQAYVKAVKSKLKAEQQLEADKERGIKQAAAEQDMADADFIRATKVRLKAEQQLEAEKERGIQRAARAQDKADKDYVRAVRQQISAVAQLEKEHEQATAAAQAQTGAVLKMVAGFAGLNAVSGIISTISDHFDKIRQDAFHAAEDVMRMRGAVRELAALRGDLGKTGDAMAHVMEGASQTLQKPEEFKEMEMAGLGIGELALKTQEDKTEFTKGLVAAGKMQAMEGGDSGAYGQMAGQIALQSKGPIKGDEMEARMNRLYEIQKPGGFKSMSQAMGQYSQLNGLVSNEIMTPEEAMGMASAFSVSNPESAATKTQAFTRSVLSGRMKARGVKVADDVDFSTTNKYMKSIGVGEKDTAIEMGKKIAADLKVNTGKGKEDAHSYLMRHGFGNQEDREAIMDYSGLLNSGRLEKIEAAQEMPLDSGAISRTFEERKKTDPYLQRQAVKRHGELVDTKLGLQEEPKVIAQEAAFNRLKDQGKIGGTFEEWKKQGSLYNIRDDALYGGYHNQVNKEAGRALSAEREKLGLPQMGTFQWSEEEAIGRSAKEVKEAGGNLTSGISDDLAMAAKEIREAAKDFRDAAKNKPGTPKDDATTKPPLSAPPPSRGGGGRMGS